MGENLKNRKGRTNSKEQMLVVVNCDWNRAFVASINILRKQNNNSRYSAKCKLTDSYIIGIAKDKEQLSNCMNEMATWVEEYKLGKTPVDTYNIAGLSWIPN